MRTDTQTFLDEVERSAGRKFLYRQDAALLVEAAERPGNRPVFDNVLFYAKFISHASAILKRYGISDEATEKLSKEYKEKLEEASALIKLLLAETPDDERQRFTDRFLTVSHASLNGLLSFLQELSWI